MASKMRTIDITKQVGDLLEKHGFGSDSNDSLNIKEAGIWDLLDALSGKNNTKFSKEAAQAELQLRGI
jgi:hypothetical protein